MGDLTKNFSKSEFACPCCGRVKIEDKLVKALQKLRDLAGSPIRITSGYRCPDHNARIGGAVNSAHLFGKASDIIIEGYTLVEMFLLAEQIDEFRKGGIGLYPEGNFLHLDIDSGCRRWCRVEGKYHGIAKLALDHILG